MKLKKKIIIVICSVIGIIIIAFLVMFGYFAYHIRDDYDTKYENKWNCEDYNINFTSDNKLFPYADATYYDASIDGNDIDINLLNGVFYIGEEKYYIEDKTNEKCGYFDKFVSGSYDYSWGTLTVTINKIYNDKYDYLKGKTLVFDK
jgi:hypothetical protein